MVQIKTTGLQYECLGIPKNNRKGAFLQGLMRKQGVQHLKNCENNSNVKLCFSFFFFSNLLSCLLKQRYKHVCM